MTGIRSLRNLFVAAAAVGLASCLSVGLAGEKTESGFTSLFNGKDLTGWQYGKKGEPLDGEKATPDQRIEVKDGAIVMNAKDAKGGGGIRDLYTTREFGEDFILKVQFKAGTKADSGVYIRGPQLQIRDFLRRGEQKQLTEFKNDGWNDLEIIVKGNEAVSTVNGQKLGTMRVPEKGPIGLQAESGEFAYKNVQIKTLD